MSNSIMAEVASQYGNTQDDLLELVEGLIDAQINWTPNQTTPSIGFHLWHMARWADYLQEMINGRGTQIWATEQLAAGWALASNSLGFADTGMGMDDSVTAALRLPEKSLLLDYVRRTFAAARQAIAQIDDTAFHTVYADLHGEGWHDGRIGPIIMTWLTHDNRHAGMIECLIGLQGMSGTADS
jgi:DinB superfamily